MALTVRSLAAAIVLATGLAACGTGQSLSPQPSPGGRVLPAGFAPWSEVAAAYRIGEGDKLKIVYPLTPEMTQDVTVRPDGMITLRAAGDVPVAGLVPAEAVRLLAARSQLRLRDPEVLLEVLDPVSATIYVGGEVNTPGAYRVAGPVDAIAALQLAAGATDTARTSEVVLIRRGPDGRPMLRHVDVQGLLEGRPVEEPRVLPGDIVFVPRTRIAEVGLWVEQFINRVVPFQRTFSYTLGRTTTTAN